MQIFNSPFLFAIGIPVIFLFAGAFAKKIVRGTKWLFEDFYLGIESTLSSMAAALVYIYDLVITTPNNHNVDGMKLAATSGFIAVSFFLLLVVIAMHQSWEFRNDKPVYKFLYLNLFCNFIGSGLMTIFVFVIKGN